MEKKIIKITINQFLKERTETEIREIQLRMDFAKRLKDMRMQLRMSTEEFVKVFKINKDYLKGAKNFNLWDISKIDAKYHEIMEEKLKEELKKETSIKVGFEK